jgi:DNA polymerase-1
MPEGEYYKAINGLMQGTGADVLKAALVRLDLAGLADFIVVPVHDEVVFSIPKGHSEIATEAARCLEDRSWEIPLTVDVTGPLRHWGEAYGFEEASHE